VVAFIMQHLHLEKMCVQCLKHLLLKFKVKMWHARLRVVWSIFKKLESDGQESGGLVTQKITTTNVMLV
jgi:hypothetical protein